VNILAQHNNIIRLRVGFGACLELCPANAINFKTIHGMITVDFDHSRCTKCNLCIKACIALSNFYRENPTIADVLGKIEKV